MFYVPHPVLGVNGIKPEVFIYTYLFNGIFFVKTGLEGSQNNLTYWQILRYFRDRAEVEILPHNENSTISQLRVQLVGLGLKEEIKIFKKP